MSRLRRALERYVCMRQGLGYKYDSPARRLSDFVSFMEARGTETITVALAMEWITKIGRQPTWAIRLTDVRCFAQHLAHFDPLTEVPPTDLVSVGRRAKPYIYSDAEIEALVAAALALPPANALRRWTFHCLFGLIAVAGLRHSEALNLHRDDVDLDQGVLTIRESKFGKSRPVPLHATTVSVLRDYSARRDAHLAPPRSPYFFVAEQGGRLLHQYVHRVFWRLSRQIGLRQKGQRNGPRVHDLRHRFAVQTLINWYRAGLDIEQQLPVLSTFLGHAYVRDTYWYLSATPELMSHAARRLDKRWGARPCATSDLPALIERWFTDRLIRHRGASANTIASYRDTFRLLFAFAQGRLRRPPSKLSLTDLGAPFICAFLDDLEMRRSATARTRNLRLTAIRSFFRYASFEAPAHNAHIQRVLAIPTKRCDKRQLHFLTRIEIDAILARPDQSTWLGRRDYALLLLAVQTGLRLSELVELDRHAVALGRGAHVRCIGKGRKERCTPLTKTAQQVLRAWLKEPARRGATTLFPNMHGGPLSTDGVQSLLNKYVAQASAECTSLRSKRISPHVLRHTAAMELLQAGVDCSVIALWLGHESIETTQTYLHAHIELKEAALAKLKPYERERAKRFRPNDRLLDFLNAL